MANRYTPRPGNVGHNTALSTNELDSRRNGYPRKSQGTGGVLHLRRVELKFVECGDDCDEAHALTITLALTMTGDA